jgi:large subunit ribosomal protein L13
MKKSNTIEVNASGQKLGRLASRIALLLMGKDQTGWKRNEVLKRVVLVKNASNLSILERKQQSKVYSRYSGYPGGLKKIPMSALIARKGKKEVLRLAVMKMLPRNKLRSLRMKNLIIEE